jgi:hypothetical protein
MVLLARFVSRRAGFWGLSLGVWTWWCLLAAITGGLAPGFSVMLLPPALLGVLSLAVVGLSSLRTRPRAREVAGLIGLAGTSWFWLPFAIGIENTEGGPELGAMIAFSVALAVSAIVPFVTVPATHHRVRRWAMASAAVLVVAATVVGLMVPTYSADRPQRLNLLQVEERHLGETRWLIEPDQPAGANAADVPATLLTAEPFAETPAPAFAWSDRHYLIALAPKTDAPAPVIEVLTDEVVRGERIVRLRLRSPRGADLLSLYVPEAAGVQRIVVTESPYVAEAPEAEDGYHAFHCHATACDGVTVELHLTSGEAVDLFIVDWTPGLTPAGADLLAARPNTAVPSQDGDGTLIVDLVSLAAL